MIWAEDALVEVARRFDIGFIVYDRDVR